MSRTDTIIIIIGVVMAWQVSGYAHTLGAFDVRFRAGLRESFDDNITSVREGGKQDFITSARVGMDAVYEGKTASLRLSGSIRQNTFLDNRDFNNTAQDLSANFLAEPSKYDTFSLSDTFSRSEEPRSFEDAFGSTAGRYRIQRNKLTFGYARDITSRFGLRARYANAIDSYSRHDMADSYSNSAGLELGYQASSRLSILGSYDLSRRDFDPGSHAITHSLGAGARVFLTPQLSLNPGAGINFITSYDGSSHRRPFLAMALQGELDKNTRADISLAKRYDTNSYSQDLFGYWQASSGIERALTERLRADCSLFYGKGEYKSLGIRDTFSGASIGLNYDVKDDIRASLAYSRSDTSSNIFSREYEKNVISAGLDVKF